MGMKKIQNDETTLVEMWEMRNETF